MSRTYLHTQIFKTPYRLLPLAVWTFFAACFLLHPLSPLRTGQLADPDDYMRLNEVIGWFQGQGWFDLSQGRMSPGAHTIIHWSRLVDLPIALIMLPFIPVVGLQSAAMIASWIIPPILFGAMLFLSAKLAENFVGTKQANLATTLVLFAPALLFNFTPGRVDHHAYQILIAGFGVFCLGKILSNDGGWRYSIASAVTFAAGLWIGTEALPWLVLFLICLSLFSARQGGLALRNAAIFGIAFAVVTTAVLFVALPLEEFSSRALSWFSSADVILAFLAALTLVLAWVFGRLTANRTLRTALSVTLGTFAAAAFLYCVPEILDGPFVNYDNFNSTTALDNINEARPFAHAFWVDRTNPLTWQRAIEAFTHSLWPALLALGAVLYNLAQKKNTERPLWLIHGIFLTAAMLLTLFWQVRVGYFMELFSLAPLTWLLCQGWDICGRRFKGRPRFWSEIGVFLALGPLPVVLLSGFFSSATLYRDIVLFPAARVQDSCNLKPVADFLSRRYATQNITLMTGMNEGPELLFRTPFQVIGGNYNVSGNTDVFRFFNARDDANAENILHQWKARLVLTCRNTPAFLTGLDHVHFGRTAFLKPGKDGKLHIISSLDHLTLMEKLVNNQPPDWLKPVEIPDGSDYLLFEVQNKVETQ